VVVDGEGGATRWQQARRVLAELVREWQDDNVSGVAAEIAFFGLLSLFPTLLALSAGLSSLDAVVGSDLAVRVRTETLDFLRRVLTDEADTTVTAVEDLFDDGSTGVLTIGAVAALWSMSRAVAAVVRGLNVAYDVEERRSWLGRRLTGLFLGVGSLVALLVGSGVLVFGPLLGGAREAADLVGAGDAVATAWAWARVPVAFVLLTAWTVVVFHFAPFERTAWRWHLPGAALATVWWMVASLGLRLYLDTGVAGNDVFGVLGGALSLTLWLYLLALGLLAGGELNAVLARLHAVERRRPAFDVGAAAAGLGARAVRAVRR
jgi:membrane protein